MGKVAEDFERFLYANYPDDYRQVTAEDVTDDVITAILSSQSSRYEVWKRIPEWIRNEYRDDIPQEVLNGNVRVETFVYEEHEKLTREDPLDENNASARDMRDADFVAVVTVALLAAGYTAESVARMSENHSARRDLLKQMAIMGRTPELVAAYRATRESDRNTIASEYDNNEKLVHKKVMRVIKEMSRMKRRKNGYDEEKYKEAEEKLKAVMAFLKDNPEAKMKVFEHLKEPAVQRALYLLDPAVRDKFITSMREVGISIKPNDGKEKSFKISRETLIDGLKRDFAERLKLEKILNNKFGRKVTEFIKAKVQDVVGVQQNDKIDKLIIKSRGDRDSMT
jgi:cytochrome c556